MTWFRLTTSGLIYKVDRKGIFALRPSPLDDVDKNTAKGGTECKV